MKLPGTRDNFSMRFLYAGEEKKVPAILDAYAQGNSNLNNVNTILELHNVKLFVEKRGHETGWSADILLGYQLLVKGITESVRLFFDSLNIDNIVSVHEDCEVVYWPDFWQFFYIFKVYERIPKESFAETIEKLHVSPEELLSNLEFVRYFDNEIAELLRKSDYGAEFIVDCCMGSEKRENVYWPHSLSSIDRNNIISLYVNSDDANPNVLQLIFDGKSRVPNVWKPDDELRFQAREKYEEIWNNRKGVSQRISTGSVVFQPGGNEAEVVFLHGSIYASYNVDWINNNTEYPTLLNNFIYLFDYVDVWGRCKLTLEVLEKERLESFIRVNGNGMYAPGIFFLQMNQLANAQMRNYRIVLEKKNIYIETMIKWFFEEYLRDEFSVREFYCIMPKETDSILSKYNRVAAVIDGIKKQFKLFCEKGQINRKLYERISQVPKYSELPSTIKNKYAYANSKDLDREMVDLFSDQSTLALQKGKIKKYSSFCSLLISEDLERNDIYKYNIQEIEWLISRGVLITEGAYLKPNYERIWILQEFYVNKVICLQYKSSALLRELIQTGEVISEGTLLSRPEARYFDYILDNYFSDGLALRNKYVHESISLNEETHEEDYDILLKMLIILVIKINEDFCLKDKLSTSTDFYEA